MAKSGKKPTELRADYPSYYMAKQKIELTPEMNIDEILAKVKERFIEQKPVDIDGVKIDFPDKWVHLRKSNTEPIIRIYSEANSTEEANEIGKHIIDLIRELA
jgi:phosphomannomutase